MSGLACATLLRIIAIPAQSVAESSLIGISFMVSSNLFPFSNDPGTPY